MDEQPCLSLRLHSEGHHLPEFAELNKYCTEVDNPLSGLYTIINLFV